MYNSTIYYMIKRIIYAGWRSINIRTGKIIFLIFFAHLALKKGAGFQLLRSLIRYKTIAYIIIFGMHIYLLYDCDQCCRSGCSFFRRIRVQIHFRIWIRVTQIRQNYAQIRYSFPRKAYKCFLCLLISSL